MVLGSFHHANKFIEPDKTGERVSIDGGQEDRRASSYFDLKPNVFYIDRFQIIAPVSKVPNSIINIHSHSCMPSFVCVSPQICLVGNPKHIITDMSGVSSFRERETNKQRESC